MDLQIINPLTHPDWDDLLLSQRDYSFFHSSHWARVLHESYHYRPLYFMRNEGGTLSVLIPCMEVKSLLTGTRGVALPFTDYCEPILSGNSMFPDMMDQIVRFGRTAGWDSMEIRSGNGFPPEVPPSSFFYVHTLDLAPGAEKLFSSFRDTVQRNIRKAMKSGVTVAISTSAESVEEFYRLNCETRKEHGLPPQPSYFFRKMYDHVISKNLGFVALASHGDRNIAGAVYLQSREKTIYKYGASSRAHQHLRANNLVMWEVIRLCSYNGTKSLCFGRTEPENAGLRKFKSGWGSEEKVLNYFKYDFQARTFVNGSSYVSGYHNKIFRRMPTPLLKAAGYILYRHMG